MAIALNMPIAFNKTFRSKRVPSVSRDSLKHALDKGNLDAIQRQLAELRLEYSDIATVRNNFIEALRGKERIYPTVLPIQATSRWSYIKPSLSNFPKKCINPDCPPYHHSRTAECWSVRDCIQPEPNTYWIEHDLNAVEHVLYCLRLDWKERLDDLKAGIDIHTPVTCSLFRLPMPSTPCIDPHKSTEDTQWRADTQWQGKDDPRRTMSKNFTYGGQYFYVRFARRNEKVRYPYRIYEGLWYNPSYVYSIPNIQSYKIVDVDESSPTYEQLVPPDYEALAIRFVESNIDIQKRKAEAMEVCRQAKRTTNFYGAPRYAYFKNQAAAKDLFNHEIQATVASYIDESCILLQAAFPDSCLIHNMHDSLKWAFTYNSTTPEGKRLEAAQTLEAVKHITQREVEYKDRSALITATYKITRREDDI